MRLTRLIVLLPLLLLVACGNQPEQSVQAPGQLGDANINWPNDPNFVVFQIDIVGGPDDFDDRNDIPLCTIYGDGRIVWLGDSQPGQTLVLFDLLNPEIVRNFVLNLAINYDIYDYSNLAEVQPLGEQRPVYEQIRLNLTNQTHTTDGFENWPASYFTEVLSECQNLSVRPAQFEPAGGWMSATLANNSTDATIIDWNAEASGINLAQLTVSRQRLWVDNEVLPIMWNIVVSSPRNRVFRQDDIFYQVAFEVPNIHRSAPPVPSVEELPDARSLTDQNDDASGEGS